MNFAEAAVFIANDLRLKTVPIGVKFLKDLGEAVEKSRRPSKALGKRVTVCQGVTMARTYRWTVALAKDDLTCVPAMITFGFTEAEDQRATLGNLFCSVNFMKDEQTARTETNSMCFLDNKEYAAIQLAPLEKGLFEPDVVVLYGNPAQIMRATQAWVYVDGKRIEGNFGGRVECSEYLIAPFRMNTARIVIPGLGDRIFSMTQDDEVVFAFPGAKVDAFTEGLREAANKIGARYPVTFYQNFQPEFPPQYAELGNKIGAFE